MRFEEIAADLNDLRDSHYLVLQKLVPIFKRESAAGRVLGSM
jgi:hypothetical protein